MDLNQKIKETYPILVKWVVRKQSDWCRYQDIDQAHDLTEIFEELHSSIQRIVNIDEINN